MLVIRAWEALAALTTPMAMSTLATSNAAQSVAVIGTTPRRDQVRITAQGPGLAWKRSELMALPLARPCRLQQLQWKAPFPMVRT